MDRRARVLLAATAVPACALAIAPGAIGDPSGTSVSCQVQLQRQTAPAPGADDLGFVTCGAPFGSGLYRDTVRTTRHSASGDFGYYLNLGTIRGRYRLSGNPRSRFSPLKGSVRITGGTGAYQGIAGAGTETCTTLDRGRHRTCEVTIQITGLNYGSTS